MKKAFSLILTLAMTFAVTGCAYDMFGHETYTSVEDYATAFELPEIRFVSARDDLFPKDIYALDVDEFYFEWGLGIVGSADVETLLSVSYDNQAFLAETARLQSLADGNVVYDEQRFSYPAYVTVLGELETSIYALVDEENLKIHYVHIQLLDMARVSISKDFLPKGYYGFGDVSGENFDVYNTFEE